MWTQSWLDLSRVIAVGAAAVVLESIGTLSVIGNDSLGTGSALPNDGART